jgi:hypothetical protein
VKKKSRFYRFRDRFLTPWWSRYLVVPGLASGPATWAAYWFAIGKKDLHGHTAPSVFLAVAIWAFFISALKSILDDTAAFSVRQLVKSRDELLYLIAHVRGIVAVKSNRFHNSGHDLRDPVEPGDAFMKITQPEIQTREIMRAVHGFFIEQSDDPLEEHVRVLLMRWNEQAGQMDYSVHFPDAEPPRVPAGAFCDKSTVAGLAREENQFVIVEDVSRDDRFRKLQGRTKEGSMCAYPVYDDLRRKTVLVINVVSSIPKRFKEADRDALEIPMQMFADRLLLENRLLELKERVRRV